MVYAKYLAMFIVIVHCLSMYSYMCIYSMWLGYYYCYLLSSVHYIIVYHYVIWSFIILGPVDVEREGLGAAGAYSKYYNHYN